MARTKTKKRFDFSDCKLLSDPYLLFKASVSVSQICDMEQAKLDKEFPEQAQRESYYYKNKLDRIDVVRTKNTLSEKDYYERRMIEDAFESSPSHKQEQTAAFLQWYDGNSDAQEVYRHATADTSWWWQDNNRMDATEARAAGLYIRPSNLNMFTQYTFGWKGRQYMELNREQVYMEGDIVVLRSPYYRNWRYDPHYSNGNYTEETPRYATIVAANGSKLAAGRRGAGSRAVSLIWFEKDGTITEIGEKYIKLHDRKGRAAQMKARYGTDE
jgi:hypothetical protein